MDFLIVLASLVFLMFVAYRGYSVILFAPIAAMGAVLFIDPNMVAPMFTGLFMDKMVGFVKNFFPVFLLGAVFGKVIELSGFSKSIVAAVIKIIGGERAMLAIIVVCAVLTYGGVSLFVDCSTQEEIDHLWTRLSEGGQQKQCGWLQDKFGITWQIVPGILSKLMTQNDKDPAAADRVMQTMTTMTRFDIQKLQDAHDGR